MCFFEGLIIQDLKRKSRSWWEKCYCTMVVCTTHMTGGGGIISFYLHVLGKLTNTWIKKEGSNKRLYFYSQELPILYLFFPGICIYIDTYMYCKIDIHLLIKVKTSHVCTEFIHMHEYVICMVQKILYTYKLHFVSYTSVFMSAHMYA